MHPMISSRMPVPGGVEESPPVIRRHRLIPYAPYITAIATDTTQRDPTLSLCGPSSGYIPVACVEQVTVSAVHTAYNDAYENCIAPKRPSQWMVIDNIYLPSC